MRAWVAMGVAGGAIVSGARDASALGPVDVEVAADGSFGTNPSSSAANPLAFGAGARAGASMMGFYAGADLAYYFGRGTANAGFDSKITEHALKVGGDLGYGFKIGPVTVRPHLGLGDLVISTSVMRGPVCACQIVQVVPQPSEQNDVYIEGAVTALVPLDMFFVGANVEFLVLPNPSDGSCCDQLETAFTFGAETGIRF